MSPLRNVNTASLASGAWSPIAMVESPLDISLPFVFPTTDSTDNWEHMSSAFFSSSEDQWDVPSLSRSSSPASSENHSAFSMSMDDLAHLLNEPVVVKQRVNSLAEMDADMATAFFEQISLQVEQQVTGKDDELQYHLQTLSPSLTLAPEPSNLDDFTLGPDGLPTRPPNAFILYRRHQQAHLRQARPGIHLHLASKLIATWWKNEPESTKAHYRRLATHGREELLKRFPDYKYRPRTDAERALAKKPKRKNSKKMDLAVSEEHTNYLQALSPFLS